MKKTFNSSIIAGKFKGKIFQIPATNTTRSTKNIIRESFFNTLQNEIYDKIFIEVFAGSGSMALEAVSRGAKFAIGIEKDRNSYEILRKNCESFDKSKFKCIYGDSFKELLSIEFNEPSILYLDPPFSIRENYESIYKDTLSLIRNFDNKNIHLIAIEHMKMLEIPENLGKFTLTKSKKFGFSIISYFKPFF